MRHDAGKGTSSDTPSLRAGARPGAARARVVPPQDCEVFTLDVPPLSDRELTDAIRLRLRAEYPGNGETRSTGEGSAAVAWSQWRCARTGWPSTVVTIPSNAW